MNKYSRINFKSILVAGLSLLIILGILLGTSSGFKYSETNKSVRITLSTTTESVEVLNSELSKFTTIANISRVNRSNSEVYIQGRTLESVLDEVNQVRTSPGITFIVEEVMPVESIGQVILNITTITALTFTAFFLSTIYFGFRKDIDKQKPSELLKLLVIFILSTCVAFVIFVPSLIIVSQLYMLKIFDFYFVYFGVFFSYILIASTMLFATDAPGSTISFANFSKNIKNNTNGLTRNTLLASLVLSLPIIIGLGSQFVLSGLIILFSILCGYLGLIASIEIISKSTNFRLKKAGVKSATFNIKLKNPNKANKLTKKVKSKPWKSFSKKRRSV